ncbi:hypothetical protein [Candidatus Blastococcus massiliensis]|nr:hypothetical protein [Candidatus Blastococcus massiliensis]
MTTSTLERQATTAPARDRAVWTCDNCRAESSAHRKRCTDCGTSRF